MPLQLLMYFNKHVHFEPCNVLLANNYFKIIIMAYFQTPRDNGFSFNCAEMVNTNP